MAVLMEQTIAHIQQGVVAERQQLVLRELDRQRSLAMVVMELLQPSLAPQ
jgi:hypothetical protein